MIKVFAAIMITLSITFVGIGVSAQSGEETTQTKTTQTVRESRLSTNREKHLEEVEARRTEAKLKITETRVAAEERRATVKAEVCERRQEHLTKLLPRLNTGATTVLNRIDTVFERVQEFYENGQLTVSDYDTKVAAIVAAQTTAATLVNALDDEVPTIDCKDLKLGVSLDTYRTSTHDAREALKAYRTELVALISSLKAVAAEQSSSEETTMETIDQEGDTQNAQ